MNIQFQWKPDTHTPDGMRSGYTLMKLYRTETGKGWNAAMGEATR